MEAKVAVVKLGSSSVTRDEGPDPVLFAQTMQSISSVRTQGWSVVLVSSGAAALGSVLLTDARSRGGAKRAGAPSRHLRSSVGQPELMNLYQFIGDTLRIDTCQVLLSENDLQDPQRMARVADLIAEALGRGRLPILNGNDATDEAVYDNDSLAASVAIACRASHLLLLSDVDGVLEEDGTTVIDQLDPQDSTRVHAINGSGSGTGGINSKVRSARLAALNGVSTTIANATTPNVIERVLRGDGLGTRLPAQRPRKATPRSLWIGGIAATEGRVVVNLEAEESIAKGASLFGSGVKRVVGRFGPNSIVEISTPGGRLIGRGSIRVSSDLLTLGRAMQPPETVELYLWLLGQLAGVEVTRHDLPPRAERAIATARTHTADRVQAMGREVLGMYPSLAATALLGGGLPTGSMDDLRAELVNQTHRLSLIDNRSLVVFRHARAAATES
jgi:glutamate 5-kinase